MGPGKAKEIFESIAENISKVVIGRRNSVELAVAALFAKGHVLLEDVPGSGKTLLAKALAASVGCSFKRIQFTPDLLPSDITGINYFNLKKSEFEFVQGPVFANIVLADEINRATPKTQAGLLESMEERQVTIDGETRPLGLPFMVIATQNPIDTQGVFPLPEAQLDRFAVKIPMSYTSRADSVEILKRHRREWAPDGLGQAATKDEILYIQALVPETAVHEDLMDYIVRIVEATRQRDEVLLGTSARGALVLMRLAQAFAVACGRDYCLPDDVKRVAVPALSHRLILRGTERAKRNAPEDIVRDILERAEVPAEGARLAR